MRYTLTLLMLGIASNNDSFFARAAVDLSSKTCSVGDESCKAQQVDDPSSSSDRNENFEGINEKCADTDSRCQFWAEKGECEKNPDYMKVGCPHSCGVRCETQDTKNDSFGSEYGEPQECTGTEREKCLEVLAKMENHMKEMAKSSEFSHILPKCQLRHSQCAFWASVGECENNPKYMQINCAPACQSCKMIDFSYRCPLDPDAYEALQSGDLDKLFERIVDGEDKEKYNVTVLSRPSHREGLSGKNDEKVDYILGPWVITIDDFVSEDECKRLIDMGDVEGYKRSTDVGEEKFDGTHGAIESLSRTSYNAWCQNECYEDPKAKSVMKKIETLTGIPEVHSEHLQLLRYEVGQYYKEHHDYIEVDRDRPAGPRVLTAYLYLNDVEKGGGTRFPKLGKTGITVMPKRGRLLLWPSVLNETPREKDFRTNHEALPVIEGEKYGANGWIHLRDFKTPNDNHCT